jgi:3-deoxy-7-phosphoheptulonate synthase
MHKDRFEREPSIIIDTNHANSGKKFSDQSRIAMEVMFSMKESEAIRRSVKGLMIESYIVEGAQSIGENVYGKSITDPCLGWDDSERLVFDLAEHFSNLL